MTLSPTEAEKRLARECAAMAAEQMHPGIPEMAAKFRSGESDDYGMSVTAACIAIHKTSEAGAEDVLPDAIAEALYDQIHLEELAKGGRMGEIRLRVVRRFIAAERAALRSGEHLERKA